MRKSDLVFCNSYALSIKQSVSQAFFWLRKLPGWLPYLLILHSELLRVLDGGFSCFRKCRFQVTKEFGA